MINGRRDVVLGSHFFNFENVSCKKKRLMLHKSTSILLQRCSRNYRVSLCIIMFLVMICWCIRCGEHWATRLTTDQHLRIVYSWVASPSYMGKFTSAKMTSKKPKITHQKRSLTSKNVTTERKITGWRMVGSASSGLCGLRAKRCQTLHPQSSGHLSTARAENC